MLLAGHMAWALFPSTMTWTAMSLFPAAPAKLISHHLTYIDGLMVLTPSLEALSIEE